MWIVAIYMDYYPEVEEFETNEEAKAAYDKIDPYLKWTVYLAEVKERK